MGGLKPSFSFEFDYSALEQVAELEQLNHRELESLESMVRGGGRADWSPDDDEVEDGEEKQDGDVAEDGVYLSDAEDYENRPSVRAGVVCP